MSLDGHPLCDKTQEFVLQNIQGAPDAVEAASRAADEMISAAVRKTKDKPGAIPQDEIVREVCHGAMKGMLLADLDLPLGAVTLIGSMAEVAQEIHVDPGQLLTWSLEGVARLASGVPREKINEIGQAIDAKFMGTAEIFRDLCRKYNQ